MDEISVLITSVGATGAQNVIKALRKQDRYKVKIIGGDADAFNAGAYLVDKFYKIPLGTESTYTQVLTDICKKENVRLFIPIMEAELEVVAMHRALFSEYNPVVAALDTICNCNDKLKCQEIIQSTGIKCPKIYCNKDEIVYPLIIKNRKGTGSVGIRVIEDKRHLTGEIFFSEDIIIQEFIKGNEYTVDCFSTKDFKFIECVPRIRIAVKGGLSTKTKTAHHTFLIQTSKEIIKALSLTGPSNIQFIEKQNGDIYFIEANPRFGGAYIASIQAGMNSPLFLLNEIMGDAIEYNGFKDIAMLRYWEEIYEYNMV